MKLSLAWILFDCSFKENKNMLILLIIDSLVSSPSQQCLQGYKTATSPLFANAFWGMNKCIGGKV
jgi:hypothetical protein